MTFSAVAENDTTATREGQCGFFAAVILSEPRIGMALDYSETARHRLNLTIKASVITKRILYQGRWTAGIPTPGAVTTEMPPTYRVSRFVILGFITARAMILQHGMSTFGAEQPFPRSTQIRHFYFSDTR